MATGIGIKTAIPIHIYHSSFTLQKSRSPEWGQSAHMLEEEGLLVSHSNIIIPSTCELYILHIELENNNVHTCQ